MTLLSLLNSLIAIMADAATKVRLRCFCSFLGSIEVS